MKNFLNGLKGTEKDIKEIIVSPIKERELILGYSSLAISNNEALGGGIGSSRDESIRIAVAEFMERAIVQEIAKSHLRNDFYLDKFPTTCGFAAGFDEEKTFLRALCEAIERWAWSKWIDENYFIPPHIIRNDELGPLAIHFKNYFDEVIFLKKEIECYHSIVGKFKAFLGISLGIKNEGIFPGSRVSLVEENLWTHPLVESYRHFDIFQKSIEERIEFSKQDIVTKRIIFFGKNKKMVLSNF